MRISFSTTHLRLLLLVAFHQWASVIWAQRVGVFNGTPTEALDVFGSIYLRGQVVVPGQTAYPGQALTPTATGLQWIDFSAASYGNYRNYMADRFGPANRTWVKPAGVKRVVIEAWAGGGGGGGAGGGGGGGYVMTEIDVSQVTQINFTIGAGGNGHGTSSATAGGNTVITWVDGAANRTVTVPGGQPASNTSAGRGGTNFSHNLPATASLLEMPGQPGSAVQMSYTQRSATEFETQTVGARGGGVHKFPDVGGYGFNALSSLTTGSSFFGFGVPAPADYPGGGGGSGRREIATSSVNDGAPGMVIVYW